MKPTRLLVPAAIAMMALLSACGPSSDKSSSVAETAAQAPATETAPATTDVVATVNGASITKDMLDTYINERTRGHASQLSASDRANLLNQLISLQLLADEAQKQGIDKKKDVAMNLELQRSSLLASTLIHGYLDSHPVSDDALKAAYQDHVKGMDLKEYKARHILVKTEAEAKDVIGKLNKGADFTALAKKLSTGPSGKDGGDLGWFSPSQMVKPFSDAVAQLKKGEYTKTPVQTRFGWHVIKLEDTRKVPAPSFDDLKNNLESTLKGQAVEAYVNDLRGKAKIDIKQQADESKAAPKMDGNGKS